MTFMLNFRNMIYYLIIKFLTQVKKSKIIYLWQKNNIDEVQKVPFDYYSESLYIK